MKKAALIALGMLVGAAGASAEEWLAKDTRSVRLDYVDDDSAGDKDAHGIELGFGAAVYALDDVSLQLSHVENDAMERQYIGVDVEENWPLRNATIPLVPFGIVGAGYGYTDVDGEGSEALPDKDVNGFVLRAALGGKIILNEWCAFSAAARLSWATNDMYLHKTNWEMEDTNWDFTFGLRFYY